MTYLHLMRTYVPRSLARGGRRAIVTIGCVAVGVSAVVALQVASLSVADALSANVRAANGGDISLSSTSAPLSAGDLDVYRQLASGGQITAWTAISRIHATAAGQAGRLIPFDADVIDLSTYPIGGQPTLVDPQGASIGDLLRSPGAVVISAALADQLGAHVGAHLSVTGVGGPGLQATVRGILAQATLGRPAVMQIRQADRSALATSPPHFVSVYANVSGTPDPAAATLRRQFPQASVRTVAESVQSAQQQIKDFHTYALVAGLVALLVAGVGIQNAMQSMLASRTAEVAVLKALGNSPLGVAGIFAVESMVLGVAGGVVGTAIGISTSSTVTSAVSRITGTRAPVHVDLAVVAEGIVLGIGATVLFSLLPITAAVAVRPLGLMRGELPQARRSAPGYAVLFLSVVALFTLLAAYVTGDLRVSTYLVAGGVIICGALSAAFALTVNGMARLPRPGPMKATFAVILLTAMVAGATSGAPAMVPLLVIALGLWTAVSLGPKRLQTWLVMATRSLDRRRARTAVTLVALMSGALAGGLTMTMATQLRSQLTDAISSSSATNLVAVAAAPSRAALLENAGRLPGVQSRQATVIAAGRVTALNGQPVPAAAGGASEEFERGRFRQLNGLTGYDLAAGSLPPAAVVTSGRPLERSDAGTNNVLIDRSLANAPASLHPRSTVQIADATTGNQVTLTVVGLYRQSGPRALLTSRYTPRIFGDVSAADRLSDGNSQTVLSMTIEPARLDSDSVTLQRRDPSVLVANLNDLTAVVRTTLNNLLLVLTVVTAMVVVAGIAVVANGVTLALIERSREVALLKAVGFGPGHVLWLVVLEYGLAGLLASAGGVICIAAALAILSSSVLENPIAFSVGISALLVATSLLVTAATAWLAARHASWARPLAALRAS